MNRQQRPQIRRQDDVPGLAPRRAALKLLDAVLRRGEPLDAASHAATQGLPASDRALAIAIASEVCRHLPDLDALIDSATQQVLPDDVKSRTVLRIALVQTLVLGTPPHAAIATSLPLVAGGPRRLVHGVFGNLSRAEAKLPETPTLPAATAERWSEVWGAEMLDAASRAIATPPPLDLSLKDAATTTQWAEQLGGTSLLPGHIRLERGGDITQLAGFDDGAWWVQDLAAAIPARLLGAGNGRSVLDIGAAPGGKTMQLAAAGWNVTALDASARRLERLADNLGRTGLTAETLNADARKLPAGRQWDAILLDAPCSATGIFRRHPDVLHRVTARDIANRADLQAELLDAAAAALKPGGDLVYAVCSLEPEEGEQQITHFLRRQKGAFAIVPADVASLPEGVTPLADGALRLSPPMLEGVGGLDGFYIAHLRKT